MQTHRGFWWLPGDEERHLAGTLTYGEHEQIRLELDLPNSTPQNPSLHVLIRTDEDQNQRKQLIVHGQSHDRKLFTLFNGFVRRASMIPPGSAELLFNYGIDGWLFDDPSNVCVSRISARFHGLVAWIDHNPFKSEHDHESQGVNIRFTMPVPMEVPIDDNRKLVLKWDRAGPNNAIVQTEMSVRSCPALGIEYATPCRLTEAQSDLGIISNLLTLLLGVPTISYDTKFSSPDAMESIGERNYPAQLRPLASRFKLKDTLDDWTPQDVLLPLEEIAAIISTVVPKWFELHEKCRPAVVPYFASLRTPMPFAEDRFFAVASVAESLHSCLVQSSPPVSRSEWIEHRKAMLAVVPETLREFVEEKLTYDKKVDYRQRLSELLGRFPSLSADVVGGPESQSRYCKIVTNLRNVEAHKLDRSKVPRDGGSLVRITDKLKTILNAWFLAECGIPDKQIESAIRSNERCWFYASNETWKWDD